MSDWAAVCVAALATIQVVVLAYIARDALKTTSSSTDTRSSVKQASKPGVER